MNPHRPGKLRKRFPTRALSPTISFLFLLSLLSPMFGNHLLPQSFRMQPVQASGRQIYWGGYLDGEHYGYGDAPWETQTIDTFERNSGKRVSIIHWGQFWHWTSQSGYSGIGDGYFQKFDTNLFERVRQRGAIPMINWNAWDGGAGGKASQPDYQLIDIINGKYDAYIRQWARDAKAWGKPFFLRFNHEMNGDWYPWSEIKNGNQRGEYVRMWRHVVDLFRQEGANNVTWVWSVNTEYASSPYSSELAALYPGDSYVDWVAIDGYNWGTNPAKPDEWKSFAQVMQATYDRLGQVAPGKPVMLSEFGSTEYGGSKAEWIKDALSVQIPNNFPRIQAVVWFNFNCYEGSGKMDWVIESSSAAKNAFAAGIGSSYYAANDFQSINTSPIPALSQAQPPTPARTSNLLMNASFENTGGAWLNPWTLNNSSGGSGTVAQDGGSKAKGAYSARVDVSSSSSAPWDVQVKQQNLALREGSTVYVSFWAKASRERPVEVVVQLGSSPYTEYARSSFNLNTRWQQYTFNFTQPAGGGSTMLAINLAQATGQVWLDEVELSTSLGREIDPVPGGEIFLPLLGK